MKSLRKLAPALAVLALLLLAPLSRAQVLKEVPSDALVVVEFNKIKSTSDKLGALAKKLALTEIQPEFADPLASIKDKGGISKGLDDNGDIAMVLLNESMQEQKPPMLLMLPVTDYEAFLSNFQGATTTNGITKTHFPQADTDDSYIAHWGNYAVIAGKPEQLARKSQGMTVDGLAAKELTSNDIVAYVNANSARARILPAIAKARTEFMGELSRLNGAAQPGAAQPAPGADANAANPPPATKPKIAPMVQTLISNGFDIAQQVVTDAKALTYGISITDDGIKTTGLADFIAQSPSAQQIALIKSTDDSFLAGLPQAKYLFFGGMRLDPKLTMKWVSYFITPMQEQAKADPAAAKALQDYFDGARAYAQAMDGINLGMLVPTGALGQESIFQVVGVTHGDAKAIQSAQRKMLENQQAFMNLMNAQGAMQVNTTFTENAKTIDGVSLNAFQTKFSPAAGRQPTPQEAQMQQMMAFMYGPQGVSGYTGVVGDNFISSMGVSDAVMQQLIASAKSNEDVLSKSPAVQSVAKALPPTHFAAGYFALDQFVSTLANYAKAFGLPINLQLPADLPPIGLSASTEGTAVRVDTYVPTQLIQSLVAAGMQAKMQMQGGAEQQPPASATQQ